MNKVRRMNSADNKWANLAVAHGAGELVGYYQAGGHPAGEYRPHHVHDANRDPPRHRHPCSLSPAAPKEAIPQTRSLQSASMVERLSRGGDRMNSDEMDGERREENAPLISPMQSARKNRGKLRLAPVLLVTPEQQQSAREICVDRRWGSISLPLCPPNRLTLVSPSPLLFNRPPKLGIFNRIRVLALTPRANTTPPLSDLQSHHLRHNQHDNFFWSDN